MKLYKLKDVARITTGRTPSKTFKEFYVDGKIPFVKPPNLSKSKPITETAEYINERGSKFANIVPKNSILVSCIGILGKVGIAGRDLATNQQINSLTFDEKIVNYKYGYYCALNLGEKLRLVSNAAVVPIVNKSSFSNLEIPVPDLELQVRIVEILDKADSLRQERKLSLKLLDEYLGSVYVEMFGNHNKEFSNWTISPLAGVSKIQSGVTKGRKFGDKTTTYVPYMRVANVQDGFIDLREIKEIEVLLSDVDKYKLMYGDLLLTEGGDPDKLGRGGIWRGQIENCIHQNHIFRVRFNTSVVNPGFASSQISSTYGKKYFLKAAKQTTGIATINITQLKAFPLIVPPLELQNRYMDIVESVEETKQSMLKQSTELDNLFYSLLQKAFRNEL